MSPVEVGGSRASDLLLALSHIEEHGFVRLWPLEVKTFLDAVSWGEQKDFLFLSLTTLEIF